MLQPEPRISSLLYTFLSSQVVPNNFIHVHLIIMKRTAESNWKAAIENVNIIDTHRPKIVGNRVFDCH